MFIAREELLIVRTHCKTRGMESGGDNVYKTIVRAIEERAMNEAGFPAGFVLD